MLNNLNHRQIIYGLLAILGAVSTMYHNLLFMEQHDGFSLSIFVLENYVNHASASIANDLIVAGSVFLIWSFFEARKLKMSHWWVYVVLNFFVAFAFAFPLFLLMRERALLKSQA